MPRTDQPAQHRADGAEGPHDSAEGQHRMVPDAHRGHAGGGQHQLPCNPA